MLVHIGGNIIVKSEVAKEQLARIIEKLLLKKSIIAEKIEVLE